MVWRPTQREIYLYISKYVYFFYFLSTSVTLSRWVFTSYFVVLNIFCMSLQGHAKNVQNHKITGEDSSAQSNWSWKKIKEINILTDIQINLSLCRTSDHYFSSSLQRTNVYLHLCKIFWGVSKSWLQKRCGCKKNHWNTVTDCMQCMY